MSRNSFGNSHLVALVRDSLTQRGERRAPPSTVREDRERYESGPVEIILCVGAWAFGPLVMLSLFAWAFA